MKKFSEYTDEQIGELTWAMIHQAFQTILPFDISDSKLMFEQYHLNSTASMTRTDCERWIAFLASHNVATPSFKHCVVSHQWNGDTCIVEALDKLTAISKGAHKMGCLTYEVMVEEKEEDEHTAAERKRSTIEGDKI